MGEKSFPIWIIILIIVIAIGIGGFFVFNIFHSHSKPSTSAEQSLPANQSESTSLFGTMLAFNPNDALMGTSSNELKKGWSFLKADSQTLSSYLSSLNNLYNSRDTLIKKTSFSPDRDPPAIFTWNVIEPQKGTFYWTLTDLAAEHARKDNTKISAVIQPFTDWDQNSTKLDSSKCPALDFAWHDYKSGPPNDWSEYEKFLTTAVERYKDVVSDWEIGNEYDGPCGGYQNNPAGYVNLLKISYETIKKADPNATVLNAGALETSTRNAQNIKNFWTQFFDLGGGNYLDAFNIHWNQERNGAYNDSTEFLTNLNFFNNLLSSHGLNKPVWITEFGTYSGTPQSQSPVGQPGMAFPTQSQEFQAAWYFRNSILAFSDNVRKILVDLVGPDNQNIGASAMYNLQGQSRPFTGTLQAINSELQGFSKVEKISEGEYKFTVGNKTVYALWSGSLPPEVKGQVKVTDLYGNEKMTNAQQISFSSSSPILVEMQQ